MQGPARAIGSIRTKDRFGLGALLARQVTFLPMRLFLPRIASVYQTWGSPFIP